MHRCDETERQRERERERERERRTEEFALAGWRKTEVKDGDFEASSAILHL